jgi:uncharacterized protein with HEPN domain
MRPDDTSALADIREAGERVLEALSGRTLESFLGDWRTQSIVERQLTILGEAVKRLTDEFRATHGAVDWRGAAGLRDILVHAYDVVDHTQLWYIATESVPRLLAQLNEISVD